ncbi:uncharacterized protein [Miscanthus floridulus]|uniref:uncharacterized protein isoform X3 n=1 Tax=Miscanthus floridulus TaxID=154761 RepID=UPI003458F224
MERESRSGVLSETASCAGTPRSVQSSCSLQRRCSSRSILKPQEGALDMSPRFPYCKPATHRDKMFNRRHSLNLPEQLPGHYSRKASERTQKATSKSVADLVGEIAALEQEVIRKELHLLSLYRRAFHQYVSESCSFTSEQQVDQDILKNIDEGALRLRDIKHSAAFNLPTVSNSEVSKSGARHSSLVNFLSASISEYVPKISCKLSEDILGCIAAVYCKLSSTEPQGAECMASPSPSVSSSSTFSPRRGNDSWSPRYNFDSPRPCGLQKESSEQNIGLIVIPRIRIDADKFDYASKMLETIRSLIQRLQKVDPMKMTHEEQLCFWINIHNALVMHAFLAYGLHDKCTKSTDMILKAVYNVGGQSVNAQTIQNSILGCQSHRPSLGRQGTPMLFTIQNQLRISPSPPEHFQTHPSGCTRRRRYSNSWRRRGRSSSRAAWWCGSRRCCCPRCCTTTPGTPRWSCGTWWSWCARACRTRSRSSSSSCSSTASGGGSTSASSGGRTSRPSDTLYIGISLTRRHVRLLCFGWFRVRS